MERLPIQKTLSDEHLQAIGLVIAQWASVEKLLVHVLCDLMAGRASDFTTTDISGLILVSGMDSRTMLGLTKSFVAIQFPERADEFDRLADKLDKEGKRRNIVAHGWWLSGDRPNSIKTSVWKTIGRAKTEPHDYTVDELRNMAKRIYKLGRRLTEFWMLAI